MMARYYRGKKSKKEQYVDRRRAGMNAREARRRTYLGEDVARRYEKAYQEVAKEDRIAAAKDARLAQEAQDAAQRAQDEAQRDFEDRKRRQREENERAAQKAADLASGRPLTTAQKLAALPQPVPELTEADKDMAAHLGRMQVSHLGLPPEFIEGWKRQTESGMDAPDPLTLSDLNGATWTAAEGLVTEGDRREAEFRAEQEHQRDQEGMWDPWKARMRRLGVL
jgi:hypothetical protein